MTLYTIEYESGTVGQMVAAGAEQPMPGPSSIQQAGTIVYDATHVMHGTMATKHAPAASNVSWAAYGNNAQFNFHASALAVRGYFYFTNIPGFRFLSFYDNAMSSVAGLGINTAGHLFIRDAVDNPLAEGTVAITTNRWLRAELYATAAASEATITAVIYEGESTTPIDTITTSTARTLSATATLPEIVAVWVGKNSYNDNQASYWVDSLAIETAATGLIGPVGAVVGSTPFRVWNGSAYVPVDMRKWNGTNYEIVSGE